MLTILRRHYLVFVVLHLLDQTLLAIVVLEGELFNLFVARFTVVEGTLEDFSFILFSFNYLLCSSQGQVEVRVIVPGNLLCIMMVCRCP